MYTILYVSIHFIMKSSRILSYCIIILYNNPTILTMTAVTQNPRGVDEFSHSWFAVSTAHINTEYTNIQFPSLQNNPLRVFLIIIWVVASACAYTTTTTLCPYSLLILMETRWLVYRICWALCLCKCAHIRTDAHQRGVLMPGPTRHSPRISVLPLITETYQRARAHAPRRRASCIIYIHISLRAISLAVCWLRDMAFEND